MRQNPASGVSVCEVLDLPLSSHDNVCRATDKVLCLKTVHMNRFRENPALDIDMDVNRIVLSRSNDSFDVAVVVQHEQLAMERKDFAL